MDLDVLEIARTWSYWDRPVPESVPRNIDLPKELRGTLCLVIQGVRRCGKSTLLQQLIPRYGLDPMRCAFLNFEDPRLARVLTHELLDELVDRFRDRHRRVKSLYFFLDEIQGVQGWERWLRSQLDRPRGNHFVATGSNATLLSGELGTALTGRHITVELFPFDLDELRSRNRAIQLDDYLRDGGFPEPLEMVDGDRLRRQYFHDIVERDVRERVGARSSAAIRQVVQMVYESAGAQLSLRRLAGATGTAIETAGGYLEACKQAYLLFECPYFAFSERKRASRNSKYYPIDTGLRRVVVTNTGEDLGKSLECAVFLRLRRDGRDVHYWSDKGEVDFVVQVDKRIIPIQVSWTDPAERHLRAMEEFYERFPFAEETVFVNHENFDHALNLGLE